MARFYGEISGTAKTTATRTGSKNSGLRAHIRGWNIGVEVRCWVDEEDRDVISVYKTGGSYDHGIGELITELKENKNG